MTFHEIHHYNSGWMFNAGWLERQAEPLLLGISQKSISIPVQLKPGGSFGHPSDLQSPMLMIGPGTGVAPFRGFLQHRQVPMCSLSVILAAYLQIP